ncbi:MAG: MFS transporter [Thermomicrobiales bacterium]
MSNPEQRQHSPPERSDAQNRSAPRSAEEAFVDPDSQATPTAMEMGVTGQGLGVSTSPAFDAEWDARAETQLAVRPPGQVTADAQRQATAAREKPKPLLEDTAFRNFWLSRLLAQIGQGALMYALLIIVVDRTDQSFYNSVFVVCAIIPTILFGLPAGVAVDQLPRRPLLVTLNLLRFLFVVSLIANDPPLPGIFATVLAMWTIHQFYAPSESAVLAALVPPARYTSAQALSNLALTISQLVGLVILAPLLLKTVGPTPLFAVCGILFILAAFLTAMLPKLDDSSQRVRRKASSLRATLLTGWQLTKHDHAMYEVMIDDVLVGIGGTALVVITPLYLKGVLDTGAENTVFVFAPAALGLVVGLRLSPRIGRLIGERRAATIGLIIFAISIAALGFVEQIRDLLNNVLLIPTDNVANTLHVPPLVLIVMLISIPAGFASSLVSVASRSVLLTRTPPAYRGQVIATQSLFQSIGALAPTLLVGVVAGVIGVEKVAIAIALLLAGGAIAAFTIYRPETAAVPVRSH